ncbi:MAG: avidin [Proteobacteria bacterium]|nr:avidin [Pseudomonadota bacterium]
MLAAVTRVIACAMVLTGAVLVAAPGRAETKMAAGLTFVAEDGSALTIKEIGANGQLTGTVTTQAGCGAKKPQPMTGWYYPDVAGGALAFSVNWEGCKSVTTWSAQYSNATGSFRALWHLAVASAPLWNGIVAGAQTFVVQPTKK